MRILPSNNLDRVGGEPNVLLPKAFFKAFLETDEEAPVLGRVLRIHEHARQAVPVEFAFSTPEAENHLRFTGHGAELLLQLVQSVSNQFLRNWAAVVKLRRQQDFVTAQGAHKWLGLRQRTESPRRPEKAGRSPAPSSRLWPSS